jgi:adenylosuccinate lyase
MNIPYRKKSLDSILSSFTKVIDDLQVLQEGNSKDIKRYDDEILARQVLKERLEVESGRALKVQEKINSLLE